MFRVIRRIISWAGKYKKRLYLGVVCSFLSSFMTAAPTMVAAQVLGKVLDSYWNNTRLQTNLIVISTISIIVFILLRFLLSFWKAVLQESIGHEVAAEKRISIGDALKRVSLGYFSKNNIGDILAGMTTELSSLELLGMKMVDKVLNGYIQLLAVIICLCFISPLAAFIVCAGALLSLFALLRIHACSLKTASVTHQVTENMSGAAIEYIRGLALVKSFGQAGIAVERFRNVCRNSKKIHVKIEGDFVPYNCLHLFVLYVTSLCLVLFSARQMYLGHIDISIFLMLILFSFVVSSGVESINDAAYVLAVVDSAMDNVERLEEVQYIDKDGEDVNISTYDIQFKDVSFGYDNRMILHDLNFNIPANTMTAIVGPSGSGKSTICNLIARFYDVKTGAVTVGGVDVREFTCDSLLKNISMVFQNVYLFRDTMKNNIKFGSPNATDEQIIVAAKAARCHDFIMALPDNYNTMVGEGGASLSGGEKQRISIARAMLKNAPIIILDEATASIDPENEHLIQEAISALTNGKTIITIAHRIATIENADQILVIENGTVMEKGTHKELLKQEGIYRQFVQVREQTEGWQIV